MVLGFAESIPKAMTYLLRRPRLIALQLSPRSSLLNTPSPKVPAYSVLGVTGSIAKASAEIFKTRLQPSPPSSLLNRPPAIAAYTVLGVAGSIVKALMAGLARPTLIALQLPPPSSLLNTPPPKVPAYRVLGVTGSIARAVIRRLV